MPEPTVPTTPWRNDTGTERPFRSRRRDDYQLQEDDEGFVLSIELPGFERESITVSWDDGVLNVVADRPATQRTDGRSYRRRFRFPKTVVDEDIEARYRNGILEIRLPVERPSITEGKEIEIQT